MEKTFWRNQISKKKEGVPETLAPSRDFAAKRQVELNEMYEQCFSIELKPWRKPFGEIKPQKKEGSRNAPRPSGTRRKAAKLGLECMSNASPWS